jgi:hypothetical protein
MLRSIALLFCCLSLSLSAENAPSKPTAGAPTSAATAPATDPPQTEEDDAEAVQYPELPVEIDGVLEVWPSVEVGVEVRAQDAVIQTKDGKRVYVVMEYNLFRAAELYSGDRVRARLIHREFVDGYEIYVVGRIEKQSEAPAAAH